MAYEYTPGTIDGGGIDPDYGDVIYGAGPGTPAGSGNMPSVSNILGGAKNLFKLAAPETYGDLTSGIPSLSDVGSFLGFGGGGAPEVAGAGFMDSAAFGGGALGAEAGAGIGGALGGAAAAFAPAGIALLVAQLLASIPNTDGSVSRGSGWADLEKGYTPAAGAQGTPGSLYADWVGDGDWIGDGDRSKVGPLSVDYGSMSRDKDLPYYGIGGAQYRTPELAVSSGRQIAQGRMGQPVTMEALPNAYNPVNGAQQLAGFQGNASMPVWDAPMEMPDDWDAMIGRRNQVGGIGEAANPVDAGYDAWRAALPERAQGFADAGLTRNQMWAATGENSPDWGTTPGSLDDVGDYSGTFDKMKERPVLQGYNWGTF